ncbi:hypothetical protein [Pseudoalteromonas sp.]|uniref:hypothetical protein n=1 Tax=Pseudoalteromonas sp. TaxID=53249 RepID=UPI002610D7C3|nr:hypothetical protein [Pseudoalteromonas sp.]MCP4589075.1 hypothetical protein [Pseudoalteromonas sp.]
MFNNQYDNYEQQHQQQAHCNDMNVSNNDPLIESKEYFQIKLYGKSSAFQFSGCKTKDGRNSVFIESAMRSNPNNPQDKTYLWGDKIMFQATFNELPQLIAVLTGFMPSIKMDNHGGESRKFLEIERQDRNFFFKMGAKDKPLRACPITFIDAHQCALLCLDQYAANFPNVSSNTIVSLIKGLAQRI